MKPRQKPHGNKIKRFVLNADTEINGQPQGVVRKTMEETHTICSRYTVRIYNADLISICLTCSVT